MKDRDIYVVADSEDGTDALVPHDSYVSSLGQAETNTLMENKL